MKNYPSTWITGSTNNRASNVTDHAASEKHKIAMLRLRTERAPVAKHCPIAISLLAPKNLYAGKAQLKLWYLLCDGEKRSLISDVSCAIRA